MAMTNANRPIERAGVNTFRALLERHGHVVHEVDGNNDHGEDLHVEIVENRRRTGHMVAVQVKSGRKYKRAAGYAIPLDGHQNDWKLSHVPVVGVVYDTDEGGLYWVNLTRELQYNADATWIDVRKSDLLEDDTVADFISNIISYIDNGGSHFERTRLVRVHEMEDGKFVLTNCSNNFLTDITIESIFDEYADPNLPKSWAVITCSYISDLEPFDGRTVGHRASDRTWTSYGPEIAVTGKAPNGEEFNEFFSFFP
ncbi:DUF4365 domain-containing protein [Nocardia pseudovaccinii]|uniref:DUF4365 domain-containing protein n=1 Tax=Nocardia pseudovaccinii TaxID=189540 RepID=UPI0009FE34E0|nr:DUF4365 domain-containing protein [Nocardia pseudovaccinii]